MVTRKQRSAHHAGKYHDEERQELEVTRQDGAAFSVQGILSGQSSLDDYLCGDKNTDLYVCTYIHSIYAYMHL